MNFPKLIDPIVVGISRSEVEAGDISSAMNVLKTFIQSPDHARANFERIDIAFQGYDHDSRELFEIPVVRNFVYQLDEHFPFWLFFLSKHHLGLQCLFLCLLPPFLTDEGKTQVFPERVGELLTKRWFPAMNQICEYVSMTEDEVESLTDRVVEYITRGPLPFPVTMDEDESKSTGVSDLKPNEPSDEQKLRKQLATCNFEMAKTILIKKFSGGVIRKELASLLDQFVANPCLDTAIKLLQFDPNFIAVFELSRGGGFTEFLFQKGDIE